MSDYIPKQVYVDQKPIEGHLVRKVGRNSKLTILPATPQDTKPVLKQCRFLLCLYLMFGSVAGVRLQGVKSSPAMTGNWSLGAEGAPRSGVVAEARCQ